LNTTESNDKDGGTFQIVEMAETLTKNLRFLRVKK